jgi:tyrosine-protein phosphatase OCA6
MSRIEDGLYRSSYPILRNFRYLNRLKLKTIISLIPESPSSDLISYCNYYNINLIHINVLRTNPLNTSLQNNLVTAINICINSTNFPILIHCIDGKRITSLFVLLLRRLQAYSPIYAISEYWRFQHITARYFISTVEIDKQTKDLEKFCVDLNNVNEIIVGEHIPRWLWNGNKNSYLAGVKIKQMSSINPSNSNVSELESNTSVDNLVTLNEGIPQDTDSNNRVGVGAVESSSDMKLSNGSIIGSDNINENSNLLNNSSQQSADNGNTNKNNGTLSEYTTNGILYNNAQYPTTISRSLAALALDGLDSKKTKTKI